MDEKSFDTNFDGESIIDEANLDAEGHPLGLPSKVWWRATAVYAEYLGLKARGDLSDDGWNNLWAALYDATLPNPAELSQVDNRGWLKGHAERVKEIGAFFDWPEPARLDVLFESRFFHHHPEPSAGLFPQHDKPPQSAASPPAAVTPATVSEPRPALRYQTAQEAKVQDFLSRVNRESKRRISMMDISTVAGHDDKSMSQLRAYRQGKLSPASKPARDIEKVLKMTIEDFIVALGRKQPDKLL